MNEALSAQKIRISLEKIFETWRCPTCKAPAFRAQLFWSGSDGITIKYDCPGGHDHVDPIASSDGAFHEIAKPKHYNQGKIECWDFIVDQNLGYLAGNVVKYVTRYRHKGTPLKDLEKAKAYLDRLIREEQEREARDKGSPR